MPPERKYEEIGELDRMDQQANVTLSALDDLLDREFPCPLCGAGLPIQRSKRGKPYCVCNLCGLQLFIRGKEGIKRMREMADSGVLITGKKESASHGINLFNRLEQLNLQKRDLEMKQGVIFRDGNVENAIQS